jgi:hypothetical protein
MSTQNPHVMIAKIFNHLPLALKMSINDDNYVSMVKKMLNEYLFYDIHEYFSYVFEWLLYIIIYYY